MRRRKLLIALTAAGIFLVGAGSASAELRSLTVTLADGRKLTLTVDVPPGTPIDQVKIPGITATIVAVQDNGPTPAPIPSPSPSAVPALPTQTPSPSATPRPTPSATPGRDDRSGAAPNQGQSPPRAKDRPRPKKRAPGGDANSQADDGDLAGKTPTPTPTPTTTPKGQDPGRRADGAPTTANPSFSLATPGAARMGVPNFFIDRFRIPPFLLPIYQAAGIQYGVRWEVLAAINEIETDYGRNLSVSSAGAMGWMQFMPSTWKTYGVDGNQDGIKDPYNPVDAIFAAARYLRAAGGDVDLEKAVFAYNHAGWYVDMVLLRARVIGGLPSNLVGSLTGLTQGRFPVNAKATYADDLSEREARRKLAAGESAAVAVESRAGQRGIKVYSRRGAAVVAASDGRIVRVGRSARLGRFVQLQDVYGNTYTYGHLGKVEATYPAPKRHAVSQRDIRRELALPKADAAPRQPASETERPAGKAREAPAPAASPARTEVRPATSAPEAAKQRLFANPDRPRARRAGGGQQLVGPKASGSYNAYLQRLFGDRSNVELKPLRAGSRVAAGTILGRLGKTSETEAPHLLFEIRPAGRGAPRIDPKPVLDGWKLLESTAVYRAAGRNPFFGSDAKAPSIGQILLMSKETLAQRVLANPRIELYGCGRRDVESSQVDRRVLATLEFLAASGLKPTVSSLRCGHGYLTASGTVSEHSSGNAVDIAAINGIPIAGHQGKGSITELTIQRLLTLQGTMKPHQIISLMKFPGAGNTFAMADHADHIHVGYRPLYGSNAKTARQLNAILKPSQWTKLIDRLDRIDNPAVRQRPSKYATRTHRGD